MKSTQATDQNVQAALQSFWQSMPTSNSQPQSKKVKVSTIDPKTGQPVTIEMEQTNLHSVTPNAVGVSSSNMGVAAAAPAPSILSQALPGGALLEKMIGGHISYIIMPVCGLVIAWSYSQMGDSHPSLGLAMSFFGLSIILELAAKFMTFPVVESALDKKLETQRVRLKAKHWYKEWIKTLGEKTEARHIKKGLQWSGIAFAFMGCFVMLGYFLMGTSKALGGNTVSSPYNTNVVQSSFMVR